MRHRWRWSEDTERGSVVAEFVMVTALLTALTLAVLQRAGLLTKRRQGREALASGDVEAVRSVGVMLTELEALWRGRISRMDELLAADATTTSPLHPPQRRTDPCPSPTSGTTSTPSP